jgi:cation/acetate symporter
MISWILPLLLWLGVVLVSIKVIDWLFPKYERQDAIESDSAPTATWYPPPMPRRRRVVATGPAGQPARANPGYWRAARKTVCVALLCWALAAFGPALLAGPLNRVSVLTGFPLGYYLTGQGTLIIFLGIISAFVWRMARLDRQFGAPEAEPDDPARMWRLFRTFGVFVLGVLGLVLFFALIEDALRLPTETVSWILMSITIGLYALIGIRQRTRNLDDYFVAGRRIPAFFNGLAIAGDWMSAASFISMAGTLWLLGYEGLAYIVGWTGGYVILATLVGPYLRRFGQYTVPDFIAARYGGSAARIVAALISVLISFTYITAQVTGIGIIMSRFLGVNYSLGVIIGLASVLFCSFLGGMRAITWTQVAQGLLLIVAYLVPVTMLSVRFTGVPIPQLMYGEALDNIARLEAQLGVTRGYVTPFNDWTPWNFGALALCLMLGTAGMPHILTRFYTVPDGPAARRSAGWALGFILLLYLTAPAYAAFSRWEVLENVVGRPLTQVPAWAINWSQAGLLDLEDQNADGVLQFSELRIHPDLVVLATPEIAGLPRAVAALVAAGGLAAALSTADGLLLVIASALSHDIYSRTINRSVSQRRRLLLGRLAVFLAATLAAITAIRRLGVIVQLVAWAFSLAAATLFPALVLGVFWRRATAAGAVSGMLAGLLVTLAYMVVTFVDPTAAVLGITSDAAGVFGIAANIAVCMVVSLLTKPDPQVNDLLDQIRTP